MKDKLLVFDLDGTLLDSLPSLAKSFNWALQKMGHPIHSVTNYRYIIGDGAKEGARRCLPNSNKESEEIEECLTLFREAYGMFWNEAKPFTGIYTMLKTSSKNHCLAVLSNKDDAFTKSCIEKFFPNIFDFISGYQPKNGLKPKAAGLLEIVKTFRHDKRNTFMIGDTATDIRTAINAGTKSIGVLWGYREEDELVEAGADQVVSSIEELVELIERNVIR